MHRSRIIEMGKIVYRKIWGLQGDIYEPKKAYPENCRTLGAMGK
jgi:hypothetical protein